MKFEDDKLKLGTSAKILKENLYRRDKIMTVISESFMSQLQQDKKKDMAGLSTKYVEMKNKGRMPDNRFTQNMYILAKKYLEFREIHLAPEFSKRLVNMEYSETNDIELQGRNKTLVAKKLFGPTSIPKETPEEKINI